MNTRVKQILIITFAGLFMSSVTLLSGCYVSAGVGEKRPVYERTYVCDKCANGKACNCRTVYYRR